ncbi:hypothetical protein C6501_08670 [Candidatus Poribacteria bacterium]|nr:MAG: hypothetical protein C6501_08670 [Candidatus Poribacteria bacterium]
MTKIKGLITLFISLAIVLSGCGKPTPGYKICRINDTLLVFLAMEDSSKIVDAILDNTELHVDINTGKRIEKRVTSIGEKARFPIIETNETLKIHGTDRISGYGVVHLTVSSPIPKNVSTWFNWSGWEIKGIRKKLGTFKNSGAFRVGDKIMVYCLLPIEKETSWEISNFGVSFEVRHSSTTFENVENDAEGHRVLSIKTDDPDMPSQSLSFQLKDLQPHETFEVVDQKKLGEGIFIVDLKVVPKKNEVIRAAPQKSRPTNQPFLRDR